MLTFTALVLAGNGKGLVGYGKGKASEVTQVCQLPRLK